VRPTSKYNVNATDQFNVAIDNIINNNDVDPSAIHHCVDGNHFF
jgi:hypothetical protein